MSDELLVIDPKEFGLEETQATDLTAGLSTILKERQVLIEAYEDVMLLELLPENLATFKELRLNIRDNRTKGIEVWHTTNKAYFLTGGRFVDAKKNMESAVNKRMEDKLMEGEKHFENLKKEADEKLQNERVELLAPYVEDAEERDLKGMEADVWESYLDTKKKDHTAIMEARAKAEAELLAKEKAEAEEQERIRLENVKLKEEAERLEARNKTRNSELQPYIVYIRDYNSTLGLDEKEYQEELKNLGIAKSDNEAFLREKQIKDQEANDKREADLKSAREASELAQRKLKAKEASELKAKDKREADEKAEALRIQSELNKGDAAKVKDLISDLESLKTKYSFKSAKNQKMYTDTAELIDKVIGHINK
jgi:colicin import membrane protein